MTSEWRHVIVMATWISFVPQLVGANGNKHQCFALLIFSEGTPLVTGGFSSQRVSDAENAFLSWRRHWRYVSYTMATTPRSTLCYQSQQMCIIVLFMSVVNILFVDNVTQERSLMRWVLNPSLNETGNVLILLKPYCMDTVNSLI